MTAYRVPGVRHAGGLPPHLQLGQERDRREGLPCVLLARMVSRRGGYPLHERHEPCRGERAPRGNGFHGNACFGKALHDGPSAYRFPRVSYEEAATDAGLCVSPGSRGVRSRSPAQCLTPHCRSRPANPFPMGDLGMTARFSRPVQPAVGKAYPI